jgi:di/tricarboxylate transporter
VTWEASLTLLIVTVMFAAMVREWFSPAVAAWGALIALMAFGIVDSRQALAGLSNAAPITVAALYVLAHAVETTGGLRPVIAAALGKGDGGRKALARLLFPAGAASAFLNNTPIVAMLMPQVIHWAEQRGIAPSRLLMPLSHAVVFGGVVTTIGTSTNLVVSGLLEARGMAPFGLFEISYIGLPLAAAGIALIVLLAPLLVPDRAAPTRSLGSGSKDFVVRMLIERGGPLEGCTVEEAGLRNLQGVFLAEIERADEIVAPVAPTTALQGGDELVFVGRAELVVDLQNRPGLVSAASEHAADLAPRQNFVEVVIGVDSPLIGRTPKQIGFRGYYQAAIVAIHRDGQPVAAKLGEVRLRLGDALLLLTDEDFRERWWGRPDFLVISPIDGGSAAASPKARLVWGIGAGFVALVATGTLGILEASLLAAAALVLTRALSVQAARRSVDVETIGLIAASFGIGAAIDSSGLADSLAHGLLGLTGGEGVRWALLAVVVSTMALTEFLSNNAAAALMFPIALSTAAAVDGDPRTFAIAVAIAASCSFLTPMGYQTNTMVFGPGGYRFSDYPRLGAPLTALTAVAIVLLA